MNARKVAVSGQALAVKYGNKLDLTKELSYGVTNSANNLIDERVKVDKLTWEIDNPTSKDQFIVVSSLFTGSVNNTIFANVADMLDNILPGVPDDQKVAFASGTLQTIGDDSLVVASKSAGRDINQFLRYIGQNPTRIVGMFMRSTANGAAESSNYDNEIKTIFASPFASNVENVLPLSPLVKIDNNFQPDKLRVKFIEEGFNVTLSNEHYLILQVNSGTKLSLTVEVGAQDSKAQRMWRRMKNADDIIRAEGML